MEGKVCKLMSDISYDQIDEEVQPWVPNTRRNRGKDSKYTKTLDLYWHYKVLVGKVLEEHNARNKAILHNMDTIQCHLNLTDKNK